MKSYWKRPIYLVLTTALGILLSMIAHAALEIEYLNWSERTGRAIHWTKFFGVGWCALPSVIQYGLVAAGAVGGFLVGRVWWRWVYVEGRHWRFTKKSNA